MPKQGREGLSELLSDLWHELTPVVRTCLFAGMGFGFFVTLYLANGVPADEPRRAMFVEIRLFIVLFFVLTFVGGFVGLAVGVGLEYVFGIKDDPNKKKRWRKRDKSSRR